MRRFPWLHSPIVLALAALFAVALVGIAVAASKFNLASELTEAVPCGEPEMQEKLKAIMLQALENAFREHVEKTFEVWMRDETQQPARARRGVRQGVNAYIHARNGVMKFKLMACP